MPLRKPSPDLTLNLPFTKNKRLDQLITRLSLAVMVFGASFFRDDVFKGLSMVIRKTTHYVTKSLDGRKPPGMSA